MQTLENYSGEKRKTSSIQIYGDTELTSLLYQIRKRLARIEAYLLAEVETEQHIPANATELLPHEEHKVAFLSLEGVDFVLPGDIVQCRARGNYTDIELTNGNHLLQSSTLKEIQGRLPDTLFLRVHQSHLVNRKYIRKYIRAHGHYLQLDNGARVPIARSRVKDFLCAMGVKNQSQSNSRIFKLQKGSVVKKMILAFFIMIFAAGSLCAQQRWGEIVTRKIPDQLRMSSMLWQLGEYSKTAPGDAISKAISKKLIVRPDGKINAEIVYGHDPEVEIDRSFLNGLGVELGTSWRNRANVWLTLEEMIPTARKLAEGYVLEAATLPDMADEGPGLMGSQDFIDHGSDGSGIRIAVIDGGFEMLTAAQSGGFAPAATRYNHTFGDIEDGSQHGTACLETVFDHAPGATYFVHRVSTLTDLGQAVDQAIDNNVDIISHSVSWYNTGWADNSGDACAAVGDATSAGMLFFVSSGNNHGGHWQGFLQDADGDDWHQWSGGDETNEFTVGDGEEVMVSMQWNADPDPVHDDYDLYLYRVSNNSVLESSTSDWSYETLSWTNDTGGSLDVYIAVKQHGTDVNEFEVINRRGGTDLEYHSSQGSTMSPSNSTAPNCISVGAVERWHYGDPPGSSGILASYSSRGPTNSGNLTPDIVGPTETTSFAYGGNWGGTSCSTPNVAGMAAALWSEHDYLSASGVRLLLFRQAELFHDWGDGGHDILYGRGGAALFRWIGNARFIYHAGGNVSGVSTLPYLNIEQADALAPSNYTMIFLGESIPAPPPGSEVIDKQMLYISAIQATEIEN